MVDAILLKQLPLQMRTHIGSVNVNHKDKLEFILQQYDFVFVLSLHRALAVGIVPVVGHEAVVIGGKEAVPLATYEVARSNSIMSVTHQKFRIHILGLMSCN